MKKRIRYSIIATVLMFAGTMAAPAVLAQGTQTAMPPTAHAAPASNPADAGPPPTNAELAHFVDAAFQVQAISKQARPEYEAAKTDADRTKIKQAVEAKMESAVQQNKLTVKRYKQIFIAMKTDKNVRNKVNALVQKKRGK